MVTTGKDIGLEKTLWDIGPWPSTQEKSLLALIYMGQVCLGIFSDKVPPFKSPF